MPIHRNGNHLINLFLMLLEMPFPSFPMMRAIFPFVFQFVARSTVHIRSKGPEAFSLEFV